MCYHCCNLSQATGAFSLFISFRAHVGFSMPVKCVKFIAVLLQDIHALEKRCQNFWKTKFSINGINTEFRKYRSILIFLFQQYCHNIKQQYQQKFLKIFNDNKGHFQLYLLSKVSIGTLFCQGVITRTFSHTKEVLYTGYKTHTAIS